MKSAPRVLTVKNAPSAFNEMCFMTLFQKQSKYLQKKVEPSEKSSDSLWRKDALGAFAGESALKTFAKCFNSLRSGNNLNKISEKVKSMKPLLRKELVESRREVL